MQPKVTTWEGWVFFHGCNFITVVDQKGIDPTRTIDVCKLFHCNKNSKHSSIISKNINLIAIIYQNMTETLTLQSQLNEEPVCQVPRLYRKEVHGKGGCGI